MSQNPGMPLNSEFESSVTTCANCRTPMPLGLRFCRNCGFRLGEGSAEYTATERFQNVQTGEAGAQQPFDVNYAAPLAQTTGGFVGKHRKRMSGMSWMFIGLLVFFLAAAAFTAIVSPIRRGGGAISIPAAPRSYVGVDDFETTDGGVTFDNVEPPGGPADNAGLVGGDIFTTVDGQPVHSDDEMREILRRIPIGKTVDVIYLRDGETKTTKLTPVTRDEFNRLEEEFSNRPVGFGRFGFDDDDTERVPIPGTKLFGVRVDDITPNYPADMAGIKEGDVVTEFDGVPIRTPGELSARVRRAIPYNTIKVIVMRGTELLEVPVKMGKQ